MSGGSRKRKRTEKFKLSTTLRDWLEYRVRLKQKQKEGLTVEQARVDIIKDACIKILFPLPLNVFASAINRLAQYEETDHLHLAERLLVINPNFDLVSVDRANDLREFLVATLSPSNVDANGATTIEIDQKLMDVAKTVLQQSHKDWIGTREALSTFLKDCTAKFHSEKNVFIVHPHLSDISRKLFLEKKQRTSVEYFFACIQNVANSKGLKFKDLIRTEVPSHEQAEVQKLMDKLFPNGIQLENDDCINDPENTYKRRIRPPLLRPRCYKQQHMILLTLRNSPDYTLARDDLIDAAISLDEKLNAETGLSRCFTGEKPRSFASACLTKNAVYFTVFKKPDSDTTYYKLSFIPNDRNDAIKHYNQWMKVMIEHDWPLCFGKPKKSSGQNVQNNGHILMLSVGAIKSRCRRCISETSCDEKLPACSKCKSEGHLCIYPFRIANQNHHNDVDTRPATATRNKKKMRQLVKQKESEDYDECSTILPDEILDGLDLTNVPKSLNDVVEVRSSTIANTGNGLFAKRNLPIGTPLGFYFGVPMLEDEFDHLKDKVGEASYYSMRYKYTILDATDEKGEPFTKEDGIFCPFHFMNEDPSNPSGNMVFLTGNKVNQIICCTKLDIEKGDELFFEICKNT